MIAAILVPLPFPVSDVSGGNGAFWKRILAPQSLDRQGFDRFRKWSVSKRFRAPWKRYLPRLSQFPGGYIYIYNICMYMYVIYIPPSVYFHRPHSFQKQREWHINPAARIASPSPHGCHDHVIAFTDNRTARITDTTAALEAMASPHIVLFSVIRLNTGLYLRDLAPTLHRSIEGLSAKTHFKARGCVLRWGHIADIGKYSYHASLSFWRGYRGISDMNKSIPQTEQSASSSEFLFKPYRRNLA